MDFLNTFNLSEPYLLHTLYAFASLALGLVGLVLGQRMTNAKVTLLFGLAVGALTVFLLTTSYAYLAPGWCAVFVLSFLFSQSLTDLVTSKPRSGGGAGQGQRNAAAGQPPATTGGGRS